MGLLYFGVDDCRLHFLKFNFFCDWGGFDNNFALLRLLDLVLDDFTGSWWEEVLFLDWGLELLGLLGLAEGLTGMIGLLVGVNLAVLDWDYFSEDWDYFCGLLYFRFARLVVYFLVVGGFRRGLLKMLFIFLRYLVAEGLCCWLRFNGEGQCDLLAVLTLFLDVIESIRFYFLSLGLFLALQIVILVMNFLVYLLMDFSMTILLVLRLHRRCFYVFSCRIQNINDRDGF